MAALALLMVPGCEKKSDDSKEKRAEAEKPTDKQKQQKKKAEKEDEKKGGGGGSNASAIPGTQNQLEWDQNIPEVDFEVTKPKDGATLDSGDKVEVEFDVDGYRIGKTIGQHVHVILDNQPYNAHYTENEPVVFEDLEPGTHTIRAFPSRHYHLSLKKNRPYDTVTFHVEKKSKDFEFDPSKPYLTYSRPKGTYSKKAAETLMLDFYTANVNFDDGHKVVYSVDGEKRGELTEWKPKVMSVGPGEHDINLKLVDGDGNLVENGGYNDTTRTITVEKP